MSLSDGLGLRVRPSGFPHGLVGWRPPLDFPSPPPNGWSTGFMATPRTLGRFPRHRLRPAFPQDTSSCSGFPTSPTVARHFASTNRISPEGSRRVANPASLASSCTPLPAEHVPPRLLLEWAGQRLLGLAAGDLGEVRHAGPPLARCGRLELPDGHVYGPFASKISMESPGASVTTARFWSGRRPAPRRVRLTFPLRFNVFTERTRTFQICWIASLISVLFDRWSTRKV